MSALTLIVILQFMGLLVLVRRVEKLEDEDRRRRARDAGSDAT